MRPAGWTSPVHAGARTVRRRCADVAVSERFACLAAPWRISDYDVTARPGVDEALIRDLATLRFLDDASNVLLIGPPGKVSLSCLTTVRSGSRT